jgi:hypothetical protein
LGRGENDPLTDVREVGDDVLIAEPEIDVSVPEQARNLLHVPKGTPNGNVSMQAFELIPNIQSAMSIYRECKQLIHVPSPVKQQSCSSSTKAGYRPIQNTFV